MKSYRSKKEESYIVRSCVSICITWWKRVISWSSEHTTYSGTIPIIDRTFLFNKPISDTYSIKKEEFMTVGLIEWNGGNDGRITKMT